MNALDLLYLPLAAIAAPFYMRKQRRGWPERFGKIAAVAPRANQRRILIHAVSVGEVSALRHLIPLLTPHAHVIISVGTDTGIKRARELFASSCDIVRYPLDVSWAVRRFLDAVRPDAVALVELELWPNFIRACRGRGIPVCIINGRLSARSFKGYSRLRFFFRSFFSSLNFAAVQDAEYAGRFEHMGVAPNDCLITGSMKWDAARIEDSVLGADELAAELGLSRGTNAPPLIVAGSTGPGEEALLHAAVSQLEKELGPIQLLCAPRKPERFNEAAQALGPTVIRRTQRRAQDSSRRQHGLRHRLPPASFWTRSANFARPTPSRTS
jgi:3-deoxy-D-manno-octulosonic-acid transferase